MHGIYSICVWWSVWFFAFFFHYLRHIRWFCSGFCPSIQKSTVFPQAHSPLNCTDLRTLASTSSLGKEQMYSQWAENRHCFVTTTYCCWTQVNLNLAGVVLNIKMKSIDRQVIHIFIAKVSEWTLCMPAQCYYWVIEWRLFYHWVIHLLYNTVE